MPPASTSADPGKLQIGGTEIENQPHAYVGRGQTTQCVIALQRPQARIGAHQHEHAVLHEQIGLEAADDLAAVDNAQRRRPVGPQAAVAELDGQGRQIRRRRMPGAERCVNGDGGVEGFGGGAIFQMLAGQAAAAGAHKALQWHRRRLAQLDADHSRGRVVGCRTRRAKRWRRQLAIAVVGVRMRIIYGVVGEGMGHATRSRVIIENLLDKGHDIVIVVSGRAHGFLTSKLAGRPRVRVEEIHGLHLKFDGNDLAVLDSMISNMKGAPEGLVKNLQVFADLLGGFDADVVVSDFESFAWAWARLHRLPLISIDNMQVLNRCDHDAFTNDNASFAFRLAKFAVKSKLPGAYHYLVSSFFHPPVRKPRTTLVPPILRPEILAAKREPGDHVLVYTTAAANADALLKTLQQLPFSFRAYGTGRTGLIGNVDCRAFSETGFVDDLRTARCVVAGGGYSLMGEAVHLHVPMLSIPVQGQYEQELNARYLELLGYGRFADAPDVDGIRAFVADAPTMQHALEKYVPRDNQMLFDCLDELLRHVDMNEPPPEKLQTPALGSYEGSSKGLTGSMKRALADDDTVISTSPSLRERP